MSSYNFTRNPLWRSENFAEPTIKKEKLFKETNDHEARSSKLSSRMPEFDSRYNQDKEVQEIISNKSMDSCDSILDDCVLISDDNSASDSKSILEEKKQLRKKCSNQAYEFVMSFKSPKEFYFWISHSETNFNWVHKRNSFTSQGKKIYYMCNYRIKKGYEVCPAVLYALFPITGSSSTCSPVMVFSCGRHKHVRTGTSSDSDFKNKISVDESSKKAVVYNSVYTASVQRDDQCQTVFPANINIRSNSNRIKSQNSERASFNKVESVVDDSFSTCSCKSKNCSTSEEFDANSRSENLGILTTSLNQEKPESRLQQKDCLIDLNDLRDDLRALKHLVNKIQGFFESKISAQSIEDFHPQGCNETCGSVSSSEPDNETASTDFPLTADLVHQNSSRSSRIILLNTIDKNYYISGDTEWLRNIFPNLDIPSQSSYVKKYCLHQSEHGLSVPQIIDRMQKHNFILDGRYEKKTNCQQHKSEFSSLLYVFVYTDQAPLL